MTFDNEIRINEAREIGKLLNEKGITYTIMKFYEEDILDDDIDLVVTRKTFKQVMRLLKKLGYKDHRKLKRGHIAHLREPLKIQFIPEFNNKQLIIHLHKTFSWNGVEYLNPKIVHKRHISWNGFWIPSKEDQHLIIIAHSIFENNSIKDIELKTFNKLKKEKLDYEYIMFSAKKYNWDHVLNFFDHNKTTDLYKFKKILALGLIKLFKDLVKLRWRYIHREIISYLIISYFWCYRISLHKGQKVEE